jgi:hypothetical protein
VRLFAVKGHITKGPECGAVCQAATGPSCDCQCGGLNHGVGA